MRTPQMRQSFNVAGLGGGNFVFLEQLGGQNFLGIRFWLLGLVSGSFGFAAEDYHVLRMLWQKQDDGQTWRYVLSGL